ncbi:CHAT domain-containing protein [Streptosporangium sp. NPDC005286]|uniref:CHAT domain-containing protein n=1 Tax=Streptosporangium sp. NPDC005286 TaxID=3154463 RepID=UPI00339F32AD
MEITIQDVLTRLGGIINDGRPDQVLSPWTSAAAAELLYRSGSWLRDHEGLPPRETAVLLYATGMLYGARYRASDRGSADLAMDSPDFVAMFVLLDLSDLCGLTVPEQVLPFIQHMRRRRPGHRDRLLGVLHPDGGSLRLLPTEDERIALGRLLLMVAKSLTPEGDPMLPALMREISRHAMEWCASTGERDALDEAVETARRAVTLLPSGSPETPEYLNALGFAAANHFDVSRDLRLLEEAATAFRRSWASAPPGSRERLSSTLGLCAVLHHRFLHGGDPSVIAEAIDAGRLALEACPPGDPAEAAVFQAYGGVLSESSMRTGDGAELREAATLLRRAAALLPPEAPERVACLKDLAMTLRNLYVLAADGPALNDAVHAAREAVARVRAEDPIRAACLTTLGSVLEEVYLRHGDDASLAESVASLREAVELLGDEPSKDLVIARSALGSALRNLAIRTGDETALEEAVVALRAASGGLNPGDPHHSFIVPRLAMSLTMRFAERGSEEDIEEAVRIAREALEMFPLRSAGRYTVLPAYAQVILIRSAYLGDLSAFPEAADALEESIDAVPPGASGRALHLDLLGTVQLLRFQASGDATCLNEGIRRKRQAVAETDPAMRDTPLLLSGLAWALRIRFDHTGERPALDEAVELCRAAAAAAPPGDAQRQAGLKELGQTLLRRAQLTGDPGELAEAIRLLREADDPIGVGDAMTERFTRSGDAADLDEALRTLREVARSPSGNLSDRLRASWKWGQAAADHGRWEEGADGFAAAVRLLPLATTRRLPRAEQERVLGSNAYFGLDAAACALHQGQPVRALELLEYGRGLLFAQSLETRSDLGELEERAPELALRVRRLRGLLDQEPSVLGTAMAGSLTAEHRWRLAAEWEEALRAVHAMGLLVPPRGEDLIATVGEDPVVVVNVSPYRSDALIVRKDGVESVHLPLLDRDRSFQHAIRFRLAVEGTVDMRVAEETLSWLWDAVAAPVLDALGLTGPPVPGGPAPRVCWCPTTALSYLPLHAAGRPGEPGVLDHVVSSYTSTLRALQHARRQPPAPPRPRRPLVVAVDRTPGMSDLPATVKEAERIAHRIPGSVLLGAVSRERLLAALPDHAWLHFAGHAYADPHRPSRSHLALGHDRLGVLDIARQDLPHAELAYLSACHTAAPTGRIADEAIHLASAFQLAGYEHVIATLWGIRDDVAAQAADHVYARLDPGVPPGAGVADAVHGASLALRERYPGRPDLWAAIIHTGPQNSGGASG